MKSAITRALRNFARGLALLAALALPLTPSVSQAGDYKGKLAQIWTMKVAGVTYATFFLGGYSWGIRHDDPGATLMYQAAATAMQTQKQVQVGCKVCSNITIDQYPTSGPITFWFPDYVLVTNLNP